MFRRLGKLEVAEESIWKDERIFEEGENISLLESARKGGREFLDHKKVSLFIYIMVILL